MRILSQQFAFMTQRNVATLSKSIARTLERLSSGKRINAASDGAAEMARGVGLESTRRSLTAALRNLNDARAMFEITDGVLAVQNDIIQRMREISLQSASGTLSSSDRAYLDQEFQQLKAEYTRLLSADTYNGQNLFDGSVRSIQVGVNKGERMSFSLTSPETLSSTSVTTTSFDGVYSARATMGLGSINWELEVGDFDNDGNEDIIATNQANNWLQVHLSNGDGTFNSLATFSLGSGRGVAVGHLNNDTNLDIVIASNSASGVRVKMGVGDGTFGAQILLNTGMNIAHVGVDDLNNDGFDDVAYIPASGLGDFVGVILSNGNGTFKSAVTFATNTGPRKLDFGDFNEDGNMDVIVGHNNAASQNLKIFYGDGAGSFSSSANLALDSPTDCFQVADLDNSGTDDIVRIDNVNNEIEFRLGNGDGTFQSATTIAVTTPEDLTLQDIDGDGNVDLTYSAGLTSNARVYLMRGYGDGTFASAYSGVDLGPSPGAVYNSFYGKIRAADFNSDGILDLAATNQSPNYISYVLSEIETTTTGQDLNILTQSSAEDMLETLDSVMVSIALARAEIGAYTSRLETIQSVNTQMRDATSEALSRMVDADYAEEMADLVREQILRESGLIVMNQMQLNLRLILKLLPSD